MKIRSLARHMSEAGSMSAAFLRMDFIDEISYPMSLVMSQVGVLVPVGVFFFVSDLVGDSPRVGGDYFTFFVVGHAMSLMLQATLRGFGDGLQRAQNRGILETFLVEPVPWTFLPFAMTIWQALLATAQAMLVLIVGWLLGANFLLSNLWQVPTLMVLGLLASQAIGIASASLLVLAKRGQPVLTLYTLAATLLAGRLFPIDMLPEWLRIFSWLIPHTYVIAAARVVLMPDPGTGTIPFTTAAQALLLFSLIAFPLALWLLSRSMQYARRLGVLSGY